jgi:hypothetical protein
MSEWAMFCSLMRHGWPGDFTDEAAAAYSALLEGTQPAQIVEAMRRLQHRGQKFRPSVAELLGELRADYTQPTFEEAFAVLWGPRGILHSARYAEKVRLVHPLIAAFVARRGLAFLRDLRPFDEQDGHWVRKDLLESWDRHVEALEGREIAVLAAGGGPRELRQMDPLKSLDLPAPLTLAQANAEAGQ